jgi:hypothetical protein
MLNNLFDEKKKQCCALNANEIRMLWNFEYKPHYFCDNVFNLSGVFAIFANVYGFNVTNQGHQSFLKCDSLHYESM